MMMLFGFEVMSVVVDHLTNHHQSNLVVAYQVDTLEISLREQLDMVDRCINSRIVCLPEIERS